LPWIINTIYQSFFALLLLDRGNINGTDGTNHRSRRMRMVRIVRFIGIIRIRGAMVGRPPRIYRIIRKWGNRAPVWNWNNNL